jgi:hypothetical protein
MIDDVSALDDDYQKAGARGATTIDVELAASDQESIYHIVLHLY